ncbi:hypothetical protein B0O99DRAFT_527876, partial [Bisporella sp. PMI_857]
PRSLHSASLAENTTFLLVNYLHKDPKTLRLYIGGGSYGPVAAQVLASFDIFPLGHCIKGLLLMAGISHIKYHKGCVRDMTCGSWAMMGPAGLTPTPL